MEVAIRFVALRGLEVSAAAAAAEIALRNSSERAGSENLQLEKCALCA